MTHDFKQIRHLGDILRGAEPDAQQAAAQPVADESLKWQPKPASNVVPGKVACAKCGFSLIRTNLYVLSGTTGPGDETTEPCPNDGNPLLPVSWEAEARDAWATCESLFERAIAAEKALAATPPAEERDQLRAQQAAAVMPMIGPLLDAWDGMTNDFKGEVREESPALARALSQIGRAMEGDGSTPAEPSRMLMGDPYPDCQFCRGTGVDSCPTSDGGVGDVDCVCRFIANPPSAQREDTER